MSANETAVWCSVIGHTQSDETNRCTICVCTSTQCVCVCMYACGCNDNDRQRSNNNNKKQHRSVVSIELYVGKLGVLRSSGTPISYLAPCSLIYAPPSKLMGALIRQRARVCVRVYVCLCLCLIFRHPENFGGGGWVNCSHFVDSGSFLRLVSSERIPHRWSSNNT